MTFDSSMNPYQAPQSVLEEQRYESCWREGKTLVMKRDSDLPQRCIKCNGDAQTPLRKKSLIWHHPGWYALILLNFIIYLVAALLVRKRAKIAFGLCEAHVKRRRTVLAASWLLFFGSIGLSLLALSNDGEHPGIVIFAILVLLAAIMVGMFGFRMPYAKRITVDEIHLGGCGEPFLGSLESRSSF